ncbi:hypothetical protein KY389_12865 [Paracoccus bogoriensis]|uniref:portal protein n=1 Tax=Paracoccus bogoriensis TaxID=242065 RepID=UPI001CA4F9F6|nr:hypothetical protein [Paracoccus bogoriensis]MBW7057575.1 hypothetical protein [Paracoccus bogoriensis]
MAGQQVTTAPQIVIQTLDLTVEALDVPKRDEIVKRIRQITGAADPDEDPNNPSPIFSAMGLPLGGVSRARRREFRSVGAPSRPHGRQELGHARGGTPKPQAWRCGGDGQPR